jgi:hypothetical protein
MTKGSSTGGAIATLRPADADPPRRREEELADCVLDVRDAWRIDGSELCECEAVRCESFEQSLAPSEDYRRYRNVDLVHEPRRQVLVDHRRPARQRDVLTLGARSRRPS